MSVQDGTTGRLYQAVLETGHPDEHAAMHKLRTAEKFVFDAKFVSFDLITGGIEFADQLAEHGLFKLPFPSVVFQLGPFIDNEPDASGPTAQPYDHVAIAWEDGDDICGRLYLIGKEHISSGCETYRLPAGTTMDRIKHDDWFDRSIIKPDIGCDRFDNTTGVRMFGLTLFGGMGILNSSGVETVAHRTPKFINTKREKNGESPIFGHNQVFIDTGKLHMPGLVQIGNSHASPRLHWRRGHIRRLASGTVSVVRPCLVGDPTRGSIEKVYVVGRRAA